MHACELCYNSYKNLEVIHTITESQRQEVPIVDSLLHWYPFGGNGGHALQHFSLLANFSGHGEQVS